MTYYKGRDARTEVVGGAITLYNGGDGKVYTLDPAQKTYFVRSVKDTLELTQPAGGRQDNVASSIDVKSGNETKTFAGLAAKVYTVSGVVTISPQQRGGEEGGGRRRGGRGGGGGGFPGGGGGFPGGGGGGGFPGGGGGGFPLYQQGGGPGGDDSGGDPNGEGPGGSFNRRGRTRTIEVSGEFWLSDSLKLPDDKKASVLTLLQASVSGGNLALKSLTDSLNKKKAIPLNSRLTFTHTVPGTGAQDAVTTTMQVTSLSSAPLPDALFRLPLGYTQVAPPASDTGQDDAVFPGGS